VEQKRHHPSYEKRNAAYREKQPVLRAAQGRIQMLHDRAPMIIIVRFRT
jgi:hypothetical protein